MSRSSLRRNGWWVAGAAGAVVAVATGLGVQNHQENRQSEDLAALDASIIGDSDIPPPGDTVRDLIAQDGPLFVHPELVDDLSPGHVERARQVLEAADQSPVRMVGYLPRPEGLDTGYTARGALHQWMDAIDEEGHYVLVFEGGATQIGSIGLDREYLSSEASRGQPGPALERVAEEVAEWTTSPAIDRRERVQRQSDYWGGFWGGLAAGGMIATVTVLPLYGVLWFLVRRRRTKER